MKKIEDLFKELGPAGKGELLTVPKKFVGPTSKKTFRDARRTLDERQGRGPRELAKDYNETWNEYVKRIQYDRREAILLKAVPERRCAKCGETRVKSRQWVILRGDALKYFEPLTCVCRSCYRRLYVNGHCAGDAGGRPRKKGRRKML